MQRATDRGEAGVVYGGREATIWSTGKVGLFLYQVDVEDLHV